MRATDLFSPSRIKKASIVFTVIIFLYGITGFLVLPRVIKSILPEKLGPLLQRKITVQKVNVNPFALSLTLIGFSARGKQPQPLLSFERLYVNAEFTSLLKKAVILKAVALEGPNFYVKKNDQGLFNFDDILKGLSAPKPPATVPQPTSTPATPVIFDIGRITIHKGRVHFIDQSLPGGFQTQLMPINLELSHLSNRPDHQAFYTLSITTEKSEKISLQGNLHLVPLSAKGQLVVENLQLPKYKPFYENHIGFKLDQGLLDLQSDFLYRAAESSGGQLSIHPALTLNRLVLKDPVNDTVFGRIPHLDVSETSIDLTGRNIIVGHLNTQDGYVLIEKTASKGLNLSRLFGGNTQSTESVSQQPAGGPEKSETPNDPSAVSPPAKASNHENAWQVMLKACEMKNYQIDFNDFTPNDPVQVKIDKIFVAAKELSTRNNHEGQLSLHLNVNQTGKISIDGPISLNPLAGQFTTISDSLDLRIIQPYINEQQIDLLIAGGRLNHLGQLQFKQSAADGISAVYSGNLEIESLATADKQQSQDFLKWESLNFSNMEIRTTPKNIAIETITLAKPFVRLVVNRDGSLNLNRIFKKKASAQTTDGKNGALPPSNQPPPPASLPDINIKSIRLDNGQFIFNDQSIQPSYKTHLDQFNGSVTGLSSMMTSYASVDLKGRLDGQAHLEVSGRINPLIKTPYIDLGIKWNDIELSPFTPYTGKYLGYVLKKGKLSLGLDYQIEKNKLLAKNKIFLNQLTLGDKVNSPNATVLPIPIALTLLTDRHGDIDLDIPIQGDLNDPEFSLTQTILQTLINLVTKLATSPFAAISNAFGEGEELNYLSFAPGSQTIDTKNKAKLDILKKALYERPRLKLEITGAFNPDTDHAALVAQGFLNLLKAQKRKKLVADKKQAPDIDAIPMEKNEIPGWIEAAFKASPTAQKTVIDQNDPQSRLEQMKAALTKEIRISDADLRLLAQNRAAQVKGYLLNDGSITADRLFILEPGSIHDSGQSADQAQVIFSIK